MNINIQAFTDEIVKLSASNEDKPTYPFSRAHETLNNLNNYGLTGYMYNRALQGRKNIGDEGLTSNEDKILATLTKEDNNKSYPISRAMTDPTAMGIYGGAIGAAGGLMSSGPGKIPLAVILAALGVGSGVAGTYLGRGIHARALVGRARKDRDGWGQRERGILQQLKDKEI